MEFLLSMKKKAQEGDATAQFTLGWTYELGKSVPQDYEIGFSWYMKAAQQGHLNAQFWIAHAYLNGTGVAKDSAKARAWFETCAAAGHARAKLALDTWPERGFDLPDEVEAAKSQSQSGTVGADDSAAPPSSLLDAPPASSKYQASFKTYW